MSRIEPLALEGAPAASQSLLAAVKKQIGSVPNIFRTLAHSPAARRLSGPQQRSLTRLARRGDPGSHRTRGRREINGCDYWLAAHAYLGKNVAKLSEGEIETNRRGKSADAKAASAVHFAARVVAERRQVDTSDVEAVRAGGFSEAEIVEILAHVALNTLTNYLNEVAETAVDFSAAPVLKAA